MMVVDLAKSERGMQRRRAGGRLLHCCCICGRLDAWLPTWSVYCSVKDMDDEVPLPKFCSAKCKSKGGKDACNVTEEMKQTAKDAEWREPKLVYRKATDIEKYREAVSRQGATQ